MPHHWLTVLVDDEFERQVAGALPVSGHLGGREFFDRLDGVEELAGLVGRGEQAADLVCTPDLIHVPTISAQAPVARSADPICG